MTYSLSKRLAYGLGPFFLLVDVWRRFGRWHEWPIILDDVIGGALLLIALGKIHRKAEEGRLYLVAAWNLDLKAIALWAWLPFLAADFGSLAAGLLTFPAPPQAGPAMPVEAIEGVGGSFNAATDRESTVYWVRVPRTEAARGLVWRAGWLKDQGKPSTTETSIAKLYATEAAVECANTAIQVHGGAGYVDDHPVERWFRDVRVTTLYEGTSQIQKLIIGRALTGINALVPS